MENLTELWKHRITWMNRKVIEKREGLRDEWLKEIFSIRIVLKRDHAKSSVRGAKWIFCSSGLGLQRNILSNREFSRLRSGPYRGTTSIPIWFKLIPFCSRSEQKMTWFLGWRKIEMFFHVLQFSSSKVKVDIQKMYNKGLAHVKYEVKSSFNSCMYNWMEPLSWTCDINSWWEIRSMSESEKEFTLTIDCHWVYLSHDCDAMRVRAK